MARTVYVCRPPPRPLPSATPTPLISSGGLFALIDTVAAVELENSDDPEQKELLLMPEGYYEREDIGPDASWRHEWDASRCWKTTEIYEQIEQHPRIARFIRADPWTYLPVLAHPGGSPLKNFTEKHRATLYESLPGTAGRTLASNNRIRQPYIKLAYQWSLHLASTLNFIHSQTQLSLILGHFDISSCWLTSSSQPYPYSLYLVPFLNANYHGGRSFYLRHGNVNTSEPFHPLYGARVKDAQPSFRVDIFLWASVVYELMTGHAPGQGQGLSEEEIEGLVPARRWPELEEEFLGRVVHACWSGDVEDADDLLKRVREQIVDAGGVVRDGDEIDGISIDVEALS